MRFTVLGEPKGKGRPRFARIGNGVRAYTPKETENYEAYVKLSYVNSVGQKKLEGQIQAEIIGVFSIPKSKSKKCRSEMIAGTILHTNKIDCDNLAKTILDALNGIAYDDDKQVCRLFVEKRYGEVPCVEVMLKEIGNEDESSV